MAEYMDRLFETFRNEMMTGLLPGSFLWETGGPGRWMSALTDIEDKGSSYEIRANLPGIRKENIEVRVRGNTLELEAKAAMETEEKGKSYIFHERSYEGFHRTLDLPEGVLPEKVVANYRDGVLTVTVPKSNPAPERKITVS